MPEPALWIADGLGESSIHLEKLRGGGSLPDSRADQGVPEADTVVRDLDQARMNRGLEGLDAGFAGSRDLIQCRSAVEGRREEGGPGGRAKVAQPAGEGTLEPGGQGGRPG